MSTLKKACIFDPDNNKKSFYVQFNPNTLSYAAGSNTSQSCGEASTNGLGHNGQVQGDPTGVTGLSTLSATLFFYTYQNETSYQDVRKEVNRIRAFLRRSNDGNGVISRKIGFSWGTLTMKGTLESISASYQMFAEDGTPVQAEVSITILGEDPDVTADGNDHAAEIKILKDAVASWREQNEIPESIGWLFA